MFMPNKEIFQKGGYLIWSILSKIRINHANGSDCVLSSVATYKISTHNFSAVWILRLTFLDRLLLDTDFRAHSSF